MPDLMRYYVSLDGQEFPLTVHAQDGADRVAISVGAEPSAPLAVEILSPSERGRPALVCVDGHVFRVLPDAPLAASGQRSAGAARRATINGQSVTLTVETELERRARPIRDRSSASTTRVLAPMPGRVVKVNVRAGDVVSAGTALLGIEAMKMENELLAPNAGRVGAILVEVGSTVEADQELLVIEPA